MLINSTAYLVVQFQRFSALLADNTLNTTHQPHATDITHDRKIRQGPQLSLHIGAHLPCILKQSLRFKDFHIGNSRRASNRMTRVGKAIGKHGAAVAVATDRLNQPIGNDYTGQGDIPGSQTLGRNNDVRRDIENRFGCVPVAQATESGHHFIRYIYDVMAAADFETGCVVSRWRNNDAPGGKYRLRNEGAHLIRANLLDLILQFFD